MSDMEIPPASGPSDKSNSTDMPVAGDYESQKKACLEAIAKINENCSSSSIIIRARPDLRLMKEIENKGYRVTYTLDYDSSREESFMCKIRITNPSYQDAGSTFIATFEDNLKSMGFNQASLETEDNLKKLFSNIMKL